MGTFINVDGDPNEVRGTGAGIRAMAEVFGGDIRGILSKINGLDASRPWGSDSFGEDFNKQYNQIGEDGKTASDRMKGWLQQAGEGAESASLKTMRAMDGYQAEDHRGGIDINSVRG